VISAPQVLATHRHGGGWSFIPGSQAHLSSLQYSDGLHLQRYDTYVGHAEPSPEMNYVDETGTRLLRQSGGYINTTSQYVKVILHHPLAMLGLFARHVINGLDQRYNTPYVEQVPPEQPLRALGFAFILLALVRIAWPAARRSLGPARWRYPIAMLLAGITSIASAVEARFLLPAASLSYIVVLAPGSSALLRREVHGPRPVVVAVSLLAGALVFAFIVHTVTTGAGQDLRFG
jgi:hypothetical protein